MDIDDEEIDASALPQFSGGMLEVQQHLADGSKCPAIICKEHRAVRG